jgi:hypothetical protein
MLFELTGLATIAHINIRRAGEEDGEVSVDVKFSVGDVPASAAAAAMGAESASAVTDSLFYPDHEDAERPARFLALAGIACTAQWRGKHTLKLSGVESVRADKVGKVTLIPRAAGMFDATFSVSIDSPPHGYIEALSGMLQDSTKITLEQDPELLP